jgi:hypothetical protein
MGKKQLEIFTAGRLIKEYGICGKWRYRLRKIFPKGVSFTIKDILDIQEDYEYPLSDIVERFYEFSGRSRIVGLKKENSQIIMDKYRWSNESDEAFMGIAWMILENGYDLASPPTASGSVVEP